MDRQLFVYVDLAGRPILAGRLWMRVRKGNESATFEYDRQWLAHPTRFSLEPALTLGPGPHHTPAGRALFGALGDSAPDRWGRVLMRRAERRRAEQEKRQPRTLSEADFLMMVDDEARVGALRFAESEGGALDANRIGGLRIPPFIKLPGLLAASERVMNDKETDEDLRLLLAPGSSLGGARPKAAVRDRDSTLAIAKFPQKTDEMRTVLWEAVALDLAGKAGIPVPAWRVETIARKPVLVLRRFDRSGAIRIPFLSAMSMLGAEDREQRSYLEIADALRQHGAESKATCTNSGAALCSTSSFRTRTIICVTTRFSTKAIAVGLARLRFESNARRVQAARPIHADRYGRRNGFHGFGLQRGRLLQPATRRGPQDRGRSGASGEAMAQSSGADGPCEKRDRSHGVSLRAQRGQPPRARTASSTSAISSSRVTSNFSEEAPCDRDLRPPPDTPVPQTPSTPRRNARARR